MKYLSTKGMSDSMRSALIESAHNDGLIEIIVATRAVRVTDSGAEAFKSRKTSVDILAGEELSIAGDRILYFLAALYLRG